MNVLVGHLIKDFLKDEFAEEVAAIDIHKKLGKTKKESTDSYLEYYYKMKLLEKVVV